MLYRRAVGPLPTQNESRKRTQSHVHSLSGVRTDEAGAVAY